MKILMRLSVCLALFGTFCLASNRQVEFSDPTGPNDSASATDASQKLERGVLESDKMSNPILEGLKDTQPILESDKMSNPILGSTSF